MSKTFRVVMPRFGAWLKELRLGGQMSAAYVGRKLGVSYQMIYNWERGMSFELTPSQLYILCSLYDVTFEEVACKQYATSELNPTATSLENLSNSTDAVPVSP